MGRTTYTLSSNTEKIAYYFHLKEVDLLRSTTYGIHTLRVVGACIPPFRSTLLLLIDFHTCPGGEAEDGNPS